MDLAAWGYERFAPAFARGARPGDVPARVVRHDRRGHLVVAAQGEVFVRHGGADAVVGDWVVLDPAAASIRAVLPRSGLVARHAPGREARAQPIAANVDLLLVVSGNDVNVRRIERYLVVAAASGARAVVVLNKQDLGASAAPPGVEVVRTSAQTGEGMDALRALVAPGVTAALVGPSGVGKSSLVNRLLEREAQPTAPVREADAKGRHTTTARHLLGVPGGGVLVDTPGMREIAPWDADEGIAQVFVDVEEAARACRFSDCAHDTEPGCAVKALVAPERLEAWRRLRQETAKAARRADARTAREDERSWGRMARDVMRAKRERSR